MSGNEAYREMYAIVGELILIANALDHQLNRICISLFDLPDAPMVEPIVASLDSARKIEIIKAYASRLKSQDWKKGLKSHAKAVEVINSARNAAAHSVLSIKQDGAVLTSPAAAKLLKAIDLQTKTADTIQIDDLRSSIKKAEATLGSGENVIENLARLQIERRRRANLKSDTEPKSG